MPACTPPGMGRRSSSEVALTTSWAPLWDTATLAERLGVTERFVRRLVDERRIPFLRIGKFIRFDPADVAAWIEQQRVEQR